jgi:hypothetical protein
MLEATFELGRRLVGEALADNRETQIPVAGALRLLSPWLWGFYSAETPPPHALPESTAEDGAPVGRLLQHPAFARWTIRSEAILHAAQEALRHPGWDLEVWVRRLAGELFGEPVVAQVFHRRLLAMSEWLLLAGDETASRLALAAAQALLEVAPQDQPFVLAMVRRDLVLALHSLKQISGQVSDSELLSRGA